MMKFLVRTLEDLVSAVVAIVHDHDRECRCKRCHGECLQCLDCSDCRAKIEEKVLKQMQAANRPV